MIDTEQAIGIMYHGYSKLLPPDGLPCGLVGAWCLDNTRLFFYPQGAGKGGRKKPRPEGRGYKPQGLDWGGRGAGATAVFFFTLRGAEKAAGKARGLKPAPTKLKGSVGATFRSRAV